MNKFLLDSFLKYVKIDTMSMEGVDKTPSTDKQFNLAKVLVKDLEELGVKDIKLNEKCILTGVLLSNSNSKLHIGFIAHMDTIPGFSGTDVKPNIVNSYDGGIIKLKGIELDPKAFPSLKNLKGKTLITTDGTTVLGADDKAGVANIMAMLKYYQETNTPHVNIHIAFTPDEEIGGGIESFDVKDFGCDYAYTVDGGYYNEINYENFNAKSITVNVHGLDIHPGDAKGKMLNASRIAFEFDSLLSDSARPEYTEGYEGFNHLCEIKGEVGYAKMDYILRNHDKKLLEKQQNEFINARDFLNKKYNSNTIELEINDSYSNMRELIEKDDRCIKRAMEAIKTCGFPVKTSPIRGGTDGARLTQMGLNTPNLGTGGYNCHGPYEFACLEEMENVVKILIEIAKEK